ncbi:unnamed protein product [Caenorhabditis angaria]|uniref:Neuropeptide-Like Protein n=1 Tax=Caenorhabditis angaria TaxID=860376 RepID=A0A9P1NC11_9PELO|nr:unnamed protein product [Caenorhabditis angaria]
MMCSILNLLIFSLVLAIVVEAIPMIQSPPFDTNEQFIQKRLSNDALIRLMMRNRGNQVGYADGSKRGMKRADVDRRSIDEEFSNCFLSPVQCMLPNNRK